MIAVIKTGGKQYVVKEGQTLNIEKVETPDGGEVFFEVLLIGDENGVTLGKPAVAEAKVAGAVLTHGRDKKINVIKFKPKVRYKRKAGHRQHFTKVRITKVS